MAAVITLTKTLALENAPFARPNTSALVVLITEFFLGGTGRAFRNISFDRKSCVQSIPLGRLASSLKVVDHILFPADLALSF